MLVLENDTTARQIAAHHFLFFILRGLQCNSLWYFQDAFFFFGAMVWNFSPHDAHNVGLAIKMRARPSYSVI